MDRVVEYKSLEWTVLGNQGSGNNKLEILNTMENLPSWIEGTDYPYSNA